MVYLFDLRNKKQNQFRGYHNFICFFYHNALIFANLELICLAPDE